MSEEMMLFSPTEVGLPEKFQHWRENQWECISETIQALQDFRWVVVNAPVGVGKSPSYIAIALLMGYRVCVLTATKGLQDQILDDFQRIGLVDIRGRNNYTCLMAPTMTCEDGSHARCSYSQGHGGLSHQCPYRAQLTKALNSQLVITNYSYWMSINKYGEGLGHFDLLILDEGHESPAEVCDQMSVTLNGREVFRMLNSHWPEGADDPDGCSINTWKEWARYHLVRAVAGAESIKEQIRLRGGVPSQEILREAARWSGLVSKLTILSESQGAWANEAVSGHQEDGFRLEPLWASQYAEQILFCGIPKVLILSATINRKTMQMLGVPPDQYAYREYPYIFPVNRSPVYWVPTADVGRNSSAEDMGLIRARIDEIIDPRMDRKAIIHSVSYKLRDWIMDQCSHTGIMITHERNSTSTQAHVARFKRAAPPAVLVSPSVATGYDFSYRTCEYQILPKLPFPIVAGSRIMEARCIKKLGGDPAYRDYLMIQTLVQACGRPMRAPDDQCETFILDNNMRWVWNRCKMDFPAWFRRLYRPIGRLPKPPAPLSLMAGVSRENDPQ